MWPPKTSWEFSFCLVLCSSTHSLSLFRSLPSTPLSIPLISPFICLSPFKHSFSFPFLPSLHPYLKCIIFHWYYPLMLLLSEIKTTYGELRNPAIFIQQPIKAITFFKPVLRGAALLKMHFTSCVIHRPLPMLETPLHFNSSPWLVKAKK